MATRDNLKNDAYEMNDMNGLSTAVDLTVFPWNRSTIADGQWLQDHAIGPLSARDVYLADRIDDTLSAIEAVSATLQNTSSAVSGNAIGFATKTMNANISKDPSVYAEWADLNCAIVPNSYTDTACPAGSLTYLTLKPNPSADIGLSFTNNTFGGIINCNMDPDNAAQIGITDKGIFYRHIGTNNPTKETFQAGETINTYYVNSEPPKFKAVPFFTDPTANGNYAVNYKDGQFDISTDKVVMHDDEYEQLVTDVNTMSESATNWVTTAELTGYQPAGEYLSGIVTDGGIASGDEGLSVTGISGTWNGTNETMSLNDIYEAVKLYLPNITVDGTTLCNTFIVKYGKTLFSAILENKDKIISFRPSDDADIQSNVSVTITDTDAKFETLVNGTYTTYQVNENDEWTSTVSDISSDEILVVKYGETPFADIAKAKYAVCYFDDIVYWLSEKKMIAGSMTQCLFINIDNKNRRILSVDGADQWTRKTEPLCPNKQDKLTAGDNITIEDNVISATGGGSSWTEVSFDNMAAAVISMAEYVSQSQSGYREELDVYADDSIEHSILKLFNTSTSDSINVMVHTNKTLFGVGNKVTNGYTYSIKSGKALFLKVDGKCIIASYSSSSQIAETGTQQYNDDGNPVDGLALSTMFSTAFKTGVERISDGIGSLVNTFSIAVKKGFDKITDAGNVGLAFSCGITNGIEPLSETGNVGLTFSNSITVEGE